MSPTFVPTACAGVARRDVLGEGVIALQVHPRFAVPAAGLVYGQTFERNGWWVLGHSIARVRAWVSRKEACRPWIR
jgi:hypothetical protein